MTSPVRGGDKIKEVVKLSDRLSGDQKSQLLHLISTLEAEIEARDVAVGVLKSECLKHLMHTGSLSSTHLPDPSYALQRDGVLCHALKAKGANNLEQSDINLIRLQGVLAKQKVALSKAVACLRESEKQKGKCQDELKELRTRLSQLELSQKEEKLRLEEASQKEEEKPEDKKVEDSVEEPEKKTDNSDLSAEVVRLQSALKEEQRQKLQLVMVLVHDRKQLAAAYLQEKARADEITKAITEERRKTQVLSRELEEESKRSLAMETEVEHYVRQLTDIKEESKRFMMDEKRKCMELEEALRRTKQEAEHLRKQLAEAHRVAMSQASAALPSQYVRAQNQNAETGGGYGIVTSDGGVPKVSPGGGRSIKGKDENDLEDSENFFLRGPPPRTTSSSRGATAKTGDGFSTVVPASSSGGLKKSGVKSASSTTNAAAAAVTAGLGKAVAGLQGKVTGVPPPVPPNKPAINVRNVMSFQSQTK